MTPVEAVKFLTEAAWKGHTKECRAIIGGKLVAESKCNCGSVSHNMAVKEALMVIGGAARQKK
jgi:hypothetical protein